MFKRLSAGRNTGLATIAAGVAALIIVPFALAAAINTTDDPNQQVNSQTTGACVHGPSPSVNCNLYDQKEDVFLSGSPSPSDAGTYFFAVLSPGGQKDANDGSANNLSSPIDTAADREFSLAADGTIKNLGTHVLTTDNRLSAWDFNDTNNNGGVYIMAVCKISDSENTSAIDVPTVTASDCKFDAFKVKTATPCTQDCGPGVASDLTGSKTATPTFNRAFTWNIAKAVDKTTITQTNGSPAATFNYTVTVNPSSHSDGTYDVSGDITVNNPNANADSGGQPDDVTGVDVTDAIDNEPNASCTVSNGSSDGGSTFTVDPTNATIPEAGSVSFPYDCSYTAAPAASSQTNRATITWTTQFLGDGSALVGNSIDATAGIDWTTATPSLTDDCIDVTDNIYGGTLSSGVCVDADSHLLGTGSLGSGVTGTLNPSSGPPYTSLDLKYSKTYTAPAIGSCVDRTNTATFTTDDTQTTGSAYKKVTICNYNAPLTIGYWGNHLANSTKNKPYYDSNCTKVPSGTGCSSNGPWDKQFLPVNLGNYAVADILTAAKIFAANNCSNASTSAQNAVACLAAQLLGAELNVANLSNPCIKTVTDGINDANKWLTGQTVDGVTGITYAGPPPASYTLTAAQRNEALTLKNKLVNYNQGGGC
jgi:hypothetical protein